MTDMGETMNEANVEEDKSKSKLFWSRTPFFQDRRERKRQWERGGN